MCQNIGIQNRIKEEDIYMLFYMKIKDWVIFEYGEDRKKWRNKE